METSKIPSNRRIITWLIIGIIGILLYVFIPSLVIMGAKSQIQLSQDGTSMLSEIWTKTPFPIRYSYYFFRVENPQDILRGAKPRLREMGPYCFDQWRTKRILGFGDGGETVRYNEYKENIFVTDDENCKTNLDEKMTTLNPPIASLGAVIAEMVKEKIPLSFVTSPLVFSTISAMLAAHSQNLFMTRSPREILYGFRINLLDTVTTLIKPLEMLGFRDLLPGGGIPNNTFGLLYGKNNTPEGPYEVYTGINGKTFPFFTKYKNQKNLKFWDGAYCNQIKGSDGSMFGPGLKKTDILWVFAAELCRSLFLVADRDSEYQGISTIRYTMNNQLFGSSKTDPRNECFCIHQKRPDRCSIDGVYDIGGCNAGAPIILSLPHFYKTDPDLALQVDGLNPNQNEHASFLEVEPMTGLPFYGVKGLQFNFRLESVSFLRGFNRIRNLSFPFVWARETGGLPDPIAHNLRNFVYTPLFYFRWAMAGLGVFGIFMAGYLLYKRIMSKSDNLKKKGQGFGHRKLHSNNLHHRSRVANSADISSIGSRETSDTVLMEGGRNSLRRKHGSLRDKAMDGQLVVRRMSGSRYLQPFMLGNSNIHQVPSIQMPPMQMPSMQMPSMQIPAMQMPSIQPSFPILAIQYPFPVDQQVANGSVESIPRFTLSQSDNDEPLSMIMGDSAATTKGSQISIGQISGVLHTPINSENSTFKIDRASSPFKPHEILPPVLTPAPSRRPSQRKSQDYGQEIKKIKSLKLIDDSNQRLSVSTSNLNTGIQANSTALSTVSLPNRIEENAENLEKKTTITALETESSMINDYSIDQENLSESDDLSYFNDNDISNNDFSDVDELNEKTLKDDYERTKQLQ